MGLAAAQPKANIRKRRRYFGNSIIGPHVYATMPAMFITRRLAEYLTMVGKLLGKEDFRADISNCSHHCRIR